MKKAPPDGGAFLSKRLRRGSAIRSAALATLIRAALTRLLARLVLTAALLLLAWLLSTATLLLTRAGIVLLLLVGILLVRIVHD